MNINKALAIIRFGLVSCAKSSPIEWRPVEYK